MTVRRGNCEDKKLIRQGTVRTRNCDCEDRELLRQETVTVRTGMQEGLWGKRSDENHVEAAE